MDLMKTRAVWIFSMYTTQFPGRKRGASEEGVGGPGPLRGVVAVDEAEEEEARRLYWKLSDEGCMYKRLWCRVSVYITIGSPIPPLSYPYSANCVREKQKGRRERQKASKFLLVFLTDQRQATHFVFTVWVTSCGLHARNPGIEARRQSRADDRQVVGMNVKWHRTVICLISLFALSLSLSSKNVFLLFFCPPTSHSTPAHIDMHTHIHTRVCVCLFFFCYFQLIQINFQIFLMPCGNHLQK